MCDHVAARETDIPAFPRPFSRFPARFIAPMVKSTIICRCRVEIVIQHGNTRSSVGRQNSLVMAFSLAGYLANFRRTFSRPFFGHLRL